MSQQDKSTSSKASDYFHAAPSNWNCAQSILKSKQDASGLSDEEIERHFRPMGGGRAEGGVCGAIYAVEHLLASDPSLAQEARLVFEKRAGALTCAALKGKCGRSCAELVNLAEEILDETAEREGLSALASDSKEESYNLPKS